MTDTTANPFLTLMQSEEDRSRQQMLATVGDAADVNPDQAAVRQRVARYLNYPVGAVNATPEQSNREATMKRVDTDTARTPVLRRNYSRADFAALASDDSGVLSKIEDHIAATTRFVMGANGGGPTLFGQAVKGGVNDLSKGAAGTFRALFETIAPVLDPLENVPSIGGNPLRRVAEGFAERARTPVFQEEKITRPMGIIEGGIVSGLRSAGTNALALPLALLPGGQGAALGLLTANVGGSSHQVAR